MEKKNQAVNVLIRPRDACIYLGIGRTKLHLLHETDPTFPRKIRLSSRCVGWRREDIDAWLAQKAKQAAGKRSA